MASLTEPSYKPDRFLSGAKILLRKILINPIEEDKVYTRRNVVYTVVFAIGMLIWIFISIEASIIVYRKLSPYNYSVKLAKGWIPYIPYVDRNDAQYNGFSSNIKPLTAAAVGYTLVLLIIERLFNKKKEIPSLILSTLFIVALYGSGVLNVYALVFVNYLIVTLFYRWPKTCKTATWMFWLALLCTSESSRAYTFSNISVYLSFLDKFKGHGNRWYMSLGFLCLKAISYNVDRVNHLHGLEENAEKRHNTLCKCKTGSTYHCRSMRTIGTLSECDYKFSSYLSYMCYAPLFICGPVITFNDYMYQMKYNKFRKFPIKETLVYALHSLFLALLLELLLHLVHIYAIYDTRSWVLLKPRHILSVLIMNFISLWLKLAVIWRFFRLWAALDNIFTVENTGYPQFSLYSISKLWKQWHRSFNKWCVRYIYIPLGGSEYSILNIWVIFSFVGLWHNFQDNVLQFGWINCILILLEIIGSFLKRININTNREVLLYIISIVSEIPSVVLALICWSAGIGAYFIGVNQAKNLFSTYFNQGHYLTTIICHFWLANFFMFSRIWPYTIFSTFYPTSEN